MSKVNLFKRVAVSAIAFTMSLSLTLSASADTGLRLKTSSIAPSVTKAALTDISDSYLSDLQPYIDELQLINDEFGYGIEFSASTEEEILRAHSEYCSMTIPEFRNYVIDLYNTNYINCTVQDLSNCVIGSSPIEYAYAQEPQAVASDTDIEEYTATQKIFISNDKPDNYFWVESTQYSYYIGESFVQKYKSFDDEGYYLPTYPTWRPYKATKWTLGQNDDPVTFTFYVKWYLTSALSVRASASYFKVKVYAKDSSVSVDLPDRHE